jgi:hypothetical protein
VASGVRERAERSAEDRASYAAEEEGAKARRVELWMDAKPVPTWEWRGKHQARKCQFSLHFVCLT